MPLEPHSRRIGGFAAFAAATFLACLVVIAALERAGAPDRLIRALGPIVALIALGVFAIGARTATLALFIAAGRRAPAFAAALAVAAVLAGAAIALGLRAVSPSDPIWPGGMLGAALGAAALGPMIRRFGAAALADVVATRFPTGLTRGVVGLVGVATGCLVAFAGFRVAVSVIEALLTMNRWWAEALVGVVLLMSAASGGAASAIWCAAAAGAGVLIIAFIGWAFPSAADGPSGLEAAAFVWPSLASRAAMIGFIGAAIGGAALIGAAPPTAACRTPISAVKAGLGGVALFVALATLAFAGTPVFLIEGGLAAAAPITASLAGAATLAAALTFASLGVVSASRAFGVALARPPQPFPRLASVRLARMRLGQMAVVIAAAFADGYGLLDPATALIAAMALALAVNAPLAALASAPRAGRLAALAAVLTAVAVGAVRLAARGVPPGAEDLLADALTAATAALVVGLIVSMVAPRRGAAPTPGAFDPFSRPSG